MYEIEPSVLTLTDPGAFLTSTIKDIALLSAIPMLKSIIALILETNVESCLRRASMSSKNFPDLSWLVVALRSDEEEDVDDETVDGDALVGKPSL